MSITPGVQGFNNGISHKKQTLQDVMDEEISDDFQTILNKKNNDIKIESADEPDQLKRMFTDPEKLLKLFLLGEMKQNPFAEEQKDPMDTMSKFIQSMLMQNQSSALAELKETLVRNNKFSATSMIGKVVEIETDKFVIKPGKGISESFMTTEETDVFHVVIKDENDVIVRQTYGNNTAAGLNRYDWDGMDENQNECPSGTYKMSISLLRKTVSAEGMEGWKVLQPATDLSGNVLEDKKEVLSQSDREIQFNYEVPNMEEVKFASIFIRDSKSNLVHTGTLEVKAEEKGTYTWNCLDKRGDRIKEDEYTVDFSLRDANFKKIESEPKPKVKISTKVEGVAISDNPDPILVTARVNAPLSKIRSIVNESSL
jgi:flagellar hook assembly protein FlgD